MNNLIRINNNSTSFKPNFEENYVVHSRLNSFQRDINKSALSIKLVIDGTERYTVNDKRYDLRANEFLLVDSNSEIGVSFSDTKMTEGICFYLNQNYVSQNTSIAKNGEEWAMDNYAESNENNYNLLSTKYSVDESDFGLMLKKIAKKISNENTPVLTDDFFLDLAFQLYNHQNDIFIKVNKLSSLKLSTRKELYCRAITARDYIEANINSTELSINKLSAISTLSEVQLHRTFKQVFNISPYQYILSSKLNKSIDLIKSGKFSFSEISTILGFADLASFSKAFKRKFGVSPKAFQM